VAERPYLADSPAIDTASIIRSKRRTVALVITDDARLVIRAPLYAPANFIQRFVDEKKPWIRRKLAEAEARPKLPARKFADGEKFLYLGSAYPLSIVDAADNVFLFDEGFYLSRLHYGSARELFTGWYRERAFTEIKGRLDRYSALSALRYDKFNITGARSKWGSCAGRGNLRFSWRLIMAPLHVIDYVVVHELAHIERKDHSKHFWSKVSELFPGYGESREWLTQNGHLLVW